MGQLTGGIPGLVQKSAGLGALARWTPPYASREQQARVLMLKGRLCLGRGQAAEALALAAYNAGPTRVDAWIRKGRGLPGPEVVEQFAFPGTRRYVERVLRTRERLGDRPAARICIGCPACP